jgi:hypothetical protein
VVIDMQHVASTLASKSASLARREVEQSDEEVHLADDRDALEDLPSSETNSVSA